MLSAYPPQQWLHDRASMLRYAYTACLGLFLKRLPFDVQVTVHRDKFL